MEDFFDCDMFIDQDYKVETFTYKSFSQPILALQSGSTDFDLTGQVVWSAAHLLSRYIVDNPSIFQDKSILELGAGAGLCGLVASHHAQKVIVTDYQDVVLSLLEKNIQYAKNSFQVERFLWGEHQALDDKIGKVDMIIGADVIFWPECIRPLVESLRFFFEKYNVDVYIASHRRSIAVETAVFEVCRQNGIEYKIILQEGDDILMSMHKTQ